MKKIAMWALLALLSGSVEVGAQAPVADASSTFNLVLQWTPQSQFAGYYMAAKKGFYTKQGIQVDILRGGPDVDPINLVKKGKADFTTMFLTGALDAVDKGVPLVNICQVVNRSNLALVAWKKRNIFELRDLDNKSVSIWEGHFGGAFYGLFRSLNIEPNVRHQYYSVNLFLRHGIDCCSTMYYNEYHMIYQAGVDPEELSVFLLRDHQFDIPEDGIYCLEETLKDHPDVCRKIAAATLEGWKYAMENPEETLDEVMYHVNDMHLPTNRAHMKWMLEKILVTIFPSSDAVWIPGVLSERSYQQAFSILKGQISMTAPPPIEKFCAEGVNAQ